MRSIPLSPEARALLQQSAQHLFGDTMLVNVQQFQQQWINAQSKGDRSEQQAIRAQVTAMGRLLQNHLNTPHAKAQWLALMGLRCSMLMPRLRV